MSVLKVEWQNVFILIWKCPRAGNVSKKYVTSNYLYYHIFVDMPILAFAGTADIDDTTDTG